VNRLRNFADDVLGSCEVIEDSSWPHRMSSVWRLRDASGAEWFLKRHRDRERYDTELMAYRTWVPALTGKAPQLRAFSAPLQAIILSAVPGEPASWPAEQRGQQGTDSTREQAVQREAGRTLRRLHGAQPAVPWPDFAAAKMEFFNSLRPAAAGLLTRHELDAARTEVAALASVPAPAQVPCHHDYTPRNWVVQGGALSVIDFEWSGPDAWLADLARLHLGIWPTRPDLREAFLEGYGRPLHAADHMTLRGCAVLTGVWLVTKAHETGRPSFEARCQTALLRLIETAT
jgi:Ser/Thr protein kinase RdoA (MazF antagonist)